jgi:hypothetical protein
MPTGPKGEKRPANVSRKPLPSGAKPTPRGPKSATVAPRPTCEARQRERDRSRRVSSFRGLPPLPIYGTV